MTKVKVVTRELWLFVTKCPLPIPHSEQVTFLIYDRFSRRKKHGLSTVVYNMQYPVWKYSGLKYVRVIRTKTLHFTMD